jgi:hypothetical protein
MTRWYASHLERLTVADFGSLAAKLHAEGDTG